MKTLVTLIFVLFISFTAQAQNNTSEAKVETVEMSIVLTTNDVEVETENEVEVARLYRRANSRVKKALSFTTKRNRAKLA